MCPREKGFVLWGHCQNLLDDPGRFCSNINEPGHEKTCPIQIGLYSHRRWLEA